MEGLFDIERSVLGLVAREMNRVIEFEWGTTVVYVLVVILGLGAIGALAQRMQARVAADGAPVGPAGSAMTTIPVTLFYLVLFWLLTGRFIFEYVLLVFGIFVVSQLYFLIVDSLMGLNDRIKQEKIFLLSQVHVNVTIGNTTMAFMLINFLVLMWTLYMALMASFRTDLAADDMQARIAIFLFAVPAVSGFLLFLPWQLSVLCNRLTDMEVRGFYLARMLPISLTTSIMLVFPSFLFGDLAQEYVPVLPTIDMLGVLPLGLFAVFGLLPFFYSSVTYSGLVRSRYQWRRKWLRDLSEALDNDTRRHRQMRSLIDELRRMVQRSPYFENYLVTLILDHYPENDDKHDELFELFGMTSHAFDEMQIGMIDRRKSDLPNWDRLTAYVDDLFLYFHTLEDDMPDRDKIGLWQTNAEDISRTGGVGNLVSPIVGALVTLVSGPVMERIIPYIDRLLDRLFG